MGGLALMGGGPNFGPITPQSLNPWLWLQPGVGLTTVSGAASSWADQSGAGDSNRNVAQATSGNRPTVNAADAAYNGLTTLSLASASHQYMKSGTASAALAQPYSFFWVGQDTAIATDSLFDDVNTLENAALLAESAPSINFFGNAGTHSVTGTGAAALLRSPCILIGVINGANSYFFINGYPLIYGNAGTSSLTGVALGSLGGVDLGVDTQNGKCCTAMWAPGAWTPAQIVGIDVYLSQLTGIAVVAD